MTRRCADHRPAAVANDSKRPRIEASHVRIVAGGNCSDRRVEIVDGRALQVLRLETFAGPAAGGCAVIAEGATHAIVITGAGKQRIDLLDGSLCTAKPQLQRPLHLRRQSGIEQQLLDRLLVELLDRAALLLQPGCRRAIWLIPVTAPPISASSWSNLRCCGLERVREFRGGAAFPGGSLN